DAKKKGKQNPGTIVATQKGGQVTFTQPGSRGSTLTLLGTSPAGLSPSIQPVSKGLVRVRFNAPAGTPHVSASLARGRGERFLGFGERSDAVVHDGGTVENRVTEGPFQDEEQSVASAFIPPAGFSTRKDATYFPIPWVISTRGFGVLALNDDQSREHLDFPWSIEADASSLDLLVVARPKPADVVRRFSGYVARQTSALQAALC